MTEIDEAIAALDRQIKALQDDRDALIRASAIIQRQNSGATITSPLVPSRLSIVDATEKVLLAADGPLHVDVIVEKLTAMGKQASKQSVVSALLRDKKRFEALGRNTYRLRDEEAAMKI